MSDKKQSSIDCLSNQSYELFEQYSEGNFDRITLNKLMLKATEQAKAMHKEETIEAYENGHNDGCRYMDSLKQDFEDGNEYYNETFGGKNE